jgi:hypothetical protein
LLVHIGDPSSNQATSLESQVIHMIQELFGQTLRRLRAWIRSLRPYPSLALFSVPVIILEPVKPVAAYLAATGQMLGSLLTLIIGELLKLVLVERLFSLTRDKLMKIPTFAISLFETGGGHRSRNPCGSNAHFLRREFLVAK